MPVNVSLTCSVVKDDSKANVNSDYSSVEALLLRLKGADFLILAW